MSSIGGIVTSMGAAAGDSGQTSVLNHAKNAKIQSGLDDLIGQYGKYASSDSTSLDNFISNYLKTAPATNAANAADTAQENDAIGGYYNGDVANTLAGFRARQSQFGNQAVEQALAQNRGNMNRSVLGGGGSGDSSWQKREGIGVASQLDLQNAMNILNQERSDYGTVLGGEVSNAGRRMALNNALTNSNVQSQMLPAELRQQLMGYNLNDLLGLSNINNANEMYATKYSPSQTELAGGVSNAVFGGGGGGGMGGGGMNFLGGGMGNGSQSVDSPFGYSQGGGGGM